MILGLNYQECPDLFSLHALNSVPPNQGTSPGCAKTSTDYGTNMKLLSLYLGKPTQVLQQTCACQRREALPLEVNHPNETQRSKEKAKNVDSPPGWFRWRFRMRPAQGRP